MRILERVMLFLYLRKIGPLDQNIIVGTLENGMKKTIFLYEIENFFWKIILKGKRFFFFFDGKGKRFLFFKH